MKVTLTSPSVKTDPRSIFYQGGKVKASFEASPNNQNCRRIIVEYAIDEPWAIQDPREEKRKLVPILAKAFNSKGNKVATKPFPAYVTDLLIVKDPNQGDGTERVANLTVTVYEDGDYDKRSTGGCRISVFDVKAEREKRGYMTMKSLADKLNLHPDTVSRFEKRQPVRNDTLIKFSKYLA